MNSTDDRTSRRQQKTAVTVAAQQLPNITAWKQENALLCFELYPSGSEGELFSRALRGVGILSRRGYETARVIGLAVGILKELTTRFRRDGRIAQRRLCVDTLRTLRYAKPRCLERDRPAAGSRDEPVYLLLKRAIEDFEQLISCLIRLDITDDFQRRKIQQAIGDMSLTIVAAEELDASGVN